MYYCVKCGHRWTPRATGSPRQCPSCWSTSIIDEATLQRAALWARFLANWQRGKGPLPALVDAVNAFMPTLPHEHIIPLPRVLPSLWAWNDVMTLVKNRDMRVRAIQRMLEIAGFPSEDATELAEVLAGE